MSKAAEAFKSSKAAHASGAWLRWLLPLRGGWPKAGATTEGRVVRPLLPLREKVDRRAAPRRMRGGGRSEAWQKLAPLLKRRVPSSTPHPPLRGCPGPPLWLRAFVVGKAKSLAFPGLRPPLLTPQGGKEGRRPALRYGRRESASPDRQALAHDGGVEGCAVDEGCVVEVEARIVQRGRRLAIADIGKAARHVVEEAGEIL